MPISFELNAASRLITAEAADPLSKRDWMDLFLAIKNHPDRIEGMDAIFDLTEQDVDISDHFIWIFAHRMMPHITKKFVVKRAFVSRIQRTAEKVDKFASYLMKNRNMKIRGFADVDAARDWIERDKTERFSAADTALSSAPLAETAVPMDLRQLRDILSATGRRIRNGSFIPEIPEDKKQGCIKGRPSFALPSDRGDECASGGFTIITPHAAEACAFTDYIYGLFRPFLDECIAQDFFERLTQAAVEYSCYVDQKDATAVNLLKVILEEAEAIADDMLSGEFPHAPVSE
jgi:hypothetical protein